MTALVKSGHSYKLDGEPTISVTAVIRDGIPKNALPYAAARVVAERAVNDWSALAELSITERLAVLRRAVQDDWGAKALRGTRLHKVMETVITGDAVELTDELEATARVLVDWLDAHKAEPLIAERPVASRTHNYAGTPDLLAWLTVDDERSLWLLDLKTGANVYAEAVIQLAAYWRAEIYSDEHGIEKAWPRLKIERAGIIHLEPDFVKLVPVDNDALDLAFETFKAAYRVARWTRETELARKLHEPWPFLETA